MGDPEFLSPHYLLSSNNIDLLLVVSEFMFILYVLAHLIESIIITTLLNKL